MCNISQGEAENSLSVIGELGVRVSLKLHLKGESTIAKLSSS